MNTSQIDKILESDSQIKKFNFLGALARDEIPKAAQYLFPCCAVVNTQIKEKPGSHWIAFMKTPDNHGIYFDSYGYPPYNLPEVAEVLSGCRDWEFNNTRLQTDFSSVCGQYTIFVLTHLARGFQLKHTVDMLDDCGDTYANDALVFSYVNNKYSKFLQSPLPKILDLPFVLQNIEQSFQP